jgi:hypothetical protein
MAKVAQQYEELRKNIIERLAFGAAIEPGALSACLTCVPTKMLSWPLLEKVIGPVEAARIRRVYKGPTRRSLKIENTAQTQSRGAGRKRRGWRR